MSGRRLDVSATQAVSSMLAAITGAIAASGLGIAGTIAGAAFLSLVSTVGAAVYRLYLARGNDRLRAAAAALAPLTTGSVVAATIVRRHGSAATGPGAGHEPERRAGSRPDAATRSLPPAGRAEGETTAPAGDHSRTWLRDTAPGGAADSGSGESGRTDSGAGLPGAGPSGTGLPGTGLPGTGPSGTGLPGTGGSGTGDSGTGDSGTGDSGPGRTRWLTGGRRRWLVAAVAALGVFVAAMGVVTAIEAMAGKPLEAVVWHKKASGTTVGGLVDGPAAQPRHSHLARSTSPSAPASPSGTPSSTAPATPTPTPTPTPTGSSSPAPTPSGSSPAAPASTAPTGPGTPGASVNSGPE